MLTNAEIGTSGRSSSRGVEILALGSPPRTRLGLAVRAARLRSIVRAESPDCVLLGDQAAHQACALVTPLGPPQCPIFYGSELQAMESTLGYRGRLPALHAARRLTTRYLDRAHRTICISRYTAGLLRALRPGAPESCIVYPCVSELVLEQPRADGAEERLRERLGWPQDAALVVLTIARISERKNQLGVLRALAHLRGRSPQRFRYAIVGNVDAPAHQDYLAQLQAFSREHGLEDAVGWISKASDEEKIDYLDGCHISVMLSQTVRASVEGFGISAIEASARGKPVVVSDQGGMPETILQGRTGYAVPPDDTARVADALAALAGDPSSRRLMGEAGRVFARAEFTPRASAERLHAQLSAGPGASPSGR